MNVGDSVLENKLVVKFYVKILTVCSILMFILIIYLVTQEQIQCLTKVICKADNRLN